MTLYRFMSQIEFRRLQGGETLTNKTNHRSTGHDSDAIGFCFFAENPEEAVHWLRGTCCTDVLVTFEVPDGFMHTATAYYRDAKYSPDDFRRPKVARTDYCCTSYSRASLRVLASTTRFRLNGPARAVVVLLCKSYRYKGQLVP